MERNRKKFWANKLVVVVMAQEYGVAVAPTHVQLIGSSGWRPWLSSVVCNMITLQHLQHAQLSSYQVMIPLLTAIWPSAQMIQ